MCSDCEGDDLDELRAHLVDDGTISGSSSGSSSSSSSSSGGEMSEADIDELIGLAMGVANGWPNATAPDYVREVYIEALKAVASELVEKHAERVAILRERNAAELAAEQEGERHGG